MNLYPLIRSILDAGQVPVIVGPTASGKTASAVQLASDFGGALEVVSADAFQVYRGMEIGTAKPSESDRARVRHHLVDICGPGESYAAGRFAPEAAAAVSESRSRGQIPVVVGGSGLYLSALIYGLHASPGRDDGPDPVVRNPPPDRAVLLEQLRALDAMAAEVLVDAPWPRLLRAVEMVRASGRTLADLRQGARQASEHHFRIVQLVTDRRGVLYPRINRRVEEMFDRGLLEEVEGLRRAGVGRDAPSQRAIGYREAHMVLDGVLGRADAITLVQKNTRRYAKRQETWFRTQFKPEDVVIVSCEE